MAYEARCNELRHTVQSQYPADGAGGGAEVVERMVEEKAVLDAIERYGIARAARLERLAGLLDLSGNAEKAWEAEAVLLRSEMRSMFAECLRNVKNPSMLGLRIVVGGADEEEKLYDAFDRAKTVGAAMDAIHHYNKELSEKTASLAAKWEESRRIAETIMREEAAVLDEIHAIMKQAVETQAEKHLNRREKVRAWVKAAADAVTLLGSAAAAALGAPPLPPDIPTDIGKETMENWDKMAGDMEARKARYDAYFRQDHASLLVMFKGARDDARDFLDKHDYTRLALDWTSKARSALSEMRSAVKTAGQKTDIDAFASIVLSKVDEAEKAAKAVWDSFLTPENQVHFFGAFSPDLDKAVLGTEKWNEGYRKIVSLDLQGLLSRWIDDDKRDYRVIDQSAMPESWSNDLRVALKDSLKKLAQTQEEIQKNNSPDMLMTWIVGNSAKLADKIR